MKCPNCHERVSFQTVAKGRLRWDPKYPNDRRYMERSITEKCPKCGHKRKSVECPYLLVDFFSI